MSGFSAVDLKYSTPPERLRPQLSTPGLQADGMGVEPSGMDGAPHGNSSLLWLDGLFSLDRLFWFDPPSPWLPWAGALRGWRLQD